MTNLSFVFLYFFDYPLSLICFRNINYNTNLATQYYKECFTFFIDMNNFLIYHQLNNYLILFESFVIKKMAKIFDYLDTMILFQFLNVIKSQHKNLYLKLFLLVTTPIITQQCEFGFHCEILAYFFLSQNHHEKMNNPSKFEFRFTDKFRFFNK